MTSHPVSLTASQEQEAHWRPGMTVAGLRLLDRLGKGGMGEVFLAEREDGSRCAVKTILGQANEKQKARFRREGQAQAAVDPRFSTL